MSRLSREVLIPAEAIRTRVAEMARAIADDTPAGTELVGIVVLKGALVFAADLVRHLPHPLSLGHVEPRRDEGGHLTFPASPEDLCIRIARADVLLIEDILDTGRTLRPLLERLRSFEPARLRTAVLLDKPSRREVPVEVEYVGFDVPDRWVVGYGMDLDERYRNLPEIRWVDEEKTSGMEQDPAPERNK